MIIAEHLWSEGILYIQGQNLNFEQNSSAFPSKLGYFQQDSENTPHLNKKKLSTNSSWDFEHVFETMDDYWVGPDENFCPESTATRWRCNHFSKKWPKSKIKKNLLNKNLSLPLTSGVEIFLGCTIFEFGFFCLQKLTNIWYKKQKMLQNDVFKKDD